MTAGTWQLTNTSRPKMLDGTFATTNAFKLALFTSGTNLGAASAAYSGVTNEVGTTNTGYATGGALIIPVLAGTVSVTWKASNPSWTAGTAGLTAKSAAIYRVGSDVMAYSDLDSIGADVTISSGSSLVLDLTTNAVFVIGEGVYILPNSATLIAVGGQPVVNDGEFPFAFPHQF